jgi:hypothetical protein
VSTHSAPHLAVPLRLTGGGRFATVAEDSRDELLQNVRVALLTRPGDRLATPELGTDDPTLRRPGAVAIALEQAQELEPRADLELVEQVLEELGNERTTVHVSSRGAS